MPTKYLLHDTEMITEAKFKFLLSASCVYVPDFHC